MSNVFSNIEVPFSSAAKANVPTSAPQITVKQAMAATPSINTELPADTAEISTKNNKKQHKGPIKAVKGFIANIKKFFATVKEYGKGTIKGITSGVVAGSVIYTGGQIANKVLETKTASVAKKAFKAANNEATKEEIKQAAMTAVENMKKFKVHKPIAVAAGIAALGISLWNASLNATERRSDIEHRWTGHKK